MKRRTAPALAGAAVAMLALPATAMADSLDAAGNGVLGETVAINTLWVVIAAVFVLLMLAGLLCLEAGMSRMKNVGTLVPKALISMAVAGLAYHAQVGLVGQQQAQAVAQQSVVVDQEKTNLSHSSESEGSPDSSAR